jgi:hypothetical protein
LPHDADIKFPSQAVRGESPFESFCSAQDKDFVMAATSGILSMLESSAGGLNKGPNKEHGDAWQTIAAMKGKRVNEVLQRDFDAPELAAQFPGQPVCVQFTLAVQDDEDVNQVAETVVALEGVGLQTDAAEISERTGLKLTRVAKPVPPPFGGFPPKPGEPKPGEPKPGDKPGEVPAPGTKPGEEEGDDDDPTDKVENRVSKIENRKSVDDFASAVSGDLQHLRDRVAAIEAISDPDLRDKKYKALLDNWDQIVADITADPESARVLEEINTDALLKGLTTKS